MIQSSWNINDQVTVDEDLQLADTVVEIVHVESTEGEQHSRRRHYAEGDIRRMGQRATGACDYNCYRACRIESAGENRSARTTSHRSWSQSASRIIRR